VSDRDGVAFLQWCLPRLRLRWRGFRRVRRLVYRRLEGRLARLALPDLAAYRAYLERHTDEWAILDACCWIPVSRFYRDRALFECVERVVLPELVARAGGDADLRCWSLGCASGEEPYTLAIIWKARLAARFPSVRFRVLGTDADAEQIGRARRGVYPAWVLKDLPGEMLLAAFTACPGGVLELQDDYRRGVELAVQDVRRAMPHGPFDLVLCRNVAFTYFDEGLQGDILGRVVDRLAHGGALILGSTESLPGNDERLEPWVPRLRIFRRRDWTSGPATGRDP
jgi:chemotaxis protein methyltransferase CheR